MNLNEVTKGDIVKFDVKRENGELIYTVTYEVSLVKENSVQVSVLSPEFLKNNELEITAKDFKAFYR